MSEEQNKKAADNHKDAPGVAKRFSNVRGWLERNIPGHVNTVIFGLLGLLVAFIYLTYGLWQTLIFSIIVLLGIGFGQWLDGDPKIFNVIRALFNR